MPNANQLTHYIMDTAFALELSHWQWDKLWVWTLACVCVCVCMYVCVCGCGCVFLQTRERRDGKGKKCTMTQSKDSSLWMSNPSAFEVPNFNGSLSQRSLMGRARLLIHHTEQKSRPPGDLVTWARLSHRRPAPRARERGKRERGTEREQTRMSQNSPLCLKVFFSSLCDHSNHSLRVTHGAALSSSHHCDTKARLH